MKAKLLQFLSSVIKSRFFYFAVGGLLLLLITFMKGCQYGKQHKICPTIVTGTTFVHDTVIHNIVDTFPYYIAGNEKIVYRDTGSYHVADTGAILKDYFATHIIDRIWRDSIVEVTLKDYISQNKPVDNVFKYRLLKDQVIVNNSVDNSVNFARYVYLGLSMPLYPFKSTNISNINYIGLDLVYAAPKMCLRLGWQPYTKTYTIGTGVKIFSFKK
jgi:hypothetical protein